MDLIIGLIIIFLVSFGFNLIPFAGPSNIIIAAWAGAAVGLENAGLSVVFFTGFIVALGATLAKGIHYGVTFFIGKQLKEKKFGKFEANTALVKKWAFMLLFLAAATPIPDEPIVFTLGLMKYSITKFFISFFLGKMSITVLGAFLGNKISGTIELFSPEMFVMSLTLTAIATAIMFKVDFSKLGNWFAKKEPVPDGGAELGKIN